jgi:hypothetical protein
MRLNLRFIIALVIAAVTLIGYFFNTSVNPVTGEKQHVNMSAAQEISLGLQAAPKWQPSTAVKAPIAGQRRRCSK